jgi:hypothetical protein
MGSVLCYYQDEKDIVVATTVQDNSVQDEPWETSIASAISRLKEHKYRLHDI